MVLHHEPRGRVLRCHHCEGLRAPPAACPKGHPVFHQGAGTQRAEEETRTLLPDARVLRFDRDTVAADKEGASLYDRFKKLEADVMVGTQLVSKGYHFPEVTLVGIVDADAMLHFPDFRGSEKTFQLLVQAAGRAGRAQKPGRVLLQTFHPEHYAIQAAAVGDYEAFAAKELEFRRELGYPPFGRLARVVLSSAEEDKAQRAAEEAAAALAPVRSNATELLGPAPAFYRKLRSRYRFHLLVKTRLPAAWPGVLEALRALRPAAGASLKVVVDPHDLF
jgi:primosomal protein N' (replication factor Y)